MRQVSAQATRPAACGFELASRNEYLGVRKVREAAVVIGMQMREDDARGISRSDAEGAQLRTDLLFVLDTKYHFPSVIGMQRSAGFEQVHTLAGVDDDHAFRMFNDPGIRGSHCVHCRSFNTASRRRSPRPRPSTCAVLIRTEPVWMAWIFMRSPQPTR
jgi:hypothetical protein